MQFDIRRFDIYRKVPKDLTQPTKTGATISILCILFISFLLISEFVGFVLPEVQSQLFVHNAVLKNENDDGRIPVTLDISVYYIKCKFLGLDIQDDLGRHEVGFIQDTMKTDINNDQGCRMKVSFKVNKVPGNFHVSTHGSSDQPENPNMSHHINDLTFGEHVAHLNSIPDSSFTSLNGREQNSADPYASHDYIMKIVPTIFENVNGYQLYPYQFTYAHREYVPYAHGGYRVPPTIWFRYDLNPITVKYTERRKPIYTFLTTVCAIVGGAFTVAGIIDSIIFTASEVFKKFEMGKLG
ncbi:unnamed protein product [Brachionus calyciflorus]|uniref:Endoplasmic reticulum-Golgi intermediate compartment protein 1 n=1 Tax=Brachionus calyciflorus TaxID=104777 RepID=A0A813SVU4_9BILA|nr:unnamed protein product [Brachionus calyciflorus]